MKFRPKTSEVEAMQWDGSEGIAFEIAAFVGNVQLSTNRDSSVVGISITTPQGSVSLNSGDWVVKAENGVSVVPAHVFEDAYEATAEAPAPVIRKGNKKPKLEVVEATEPEEILEAIAEV